MVLSSKSKQTSNLNPAMYIVLLSVRYASTAKGQEFDTYEQHFILFIILQA